MSGTTPYQIEHECPQCSAPVVLDEGDHLLTCPYCKVKLYLAFDSYPRYYLPSSANAGRSLFVPYWRSKGIEFSIRAAGIQDSVVDRTWNASKYACFPSSLGVRPQTLKLHLMEPGRQAHVLPALTPPDAPPPVPPLSSLIGRNFPEENDLLFFRTFLRDAFALIYLPTHVTGGTLCDGVDSKPLDVPPSDLPEDNWPVDDLQDFRYCFMPAICPNCGNDLAGEKQSCVVFCPTCMLGYSISNGLLQGTPFLVTKGGSRNSLLLPFWRFHLEPEGLPLPRTTGRILPGARMEEFDTQNVFFWIPAFRLNPKLFLRLAHLATMAHLDVEQEDAGSRVPSIQAVTIPAAEAVKSIKLVLALLSPRNQELLFRLNHLEVTVKEIALVLVPFESTGYELTNRQIQTGIHRNALKYGRNL